jgi:beta-lactamase class A
MRLATLAPLPTLIVGTVFLLATGAVAGWQARVRSEPGPTETPARSTLGTPDAAPGHLTRGPGGRGRLTRPVLAYEAPVQTQPALDALHRAMEGAVDRARKDGGVERAGVYFQELETGDVRVVDGKARFAPASLYKVPVAVALMAQVADAPDLLSRRVRFAAEAQGAAGDAPAADPLRPGADYSVRELLTRMLAQSDNDAYNLLTAVVRDESWQTLTATLGLPAVKDRRERDLVTPRGYALVFQALFNVGVLPARESELLLGILSQTTFADGLRLGLPRDAAVAHKFGYRVLDRDHPNPTHQLHDCGIVYGNRAAYLLCVMTRGSDYGALSALIGEVSRLAWQATNGTAAPPM